MSAVAAVVALVALLIGVPTAHAVTPANSMPGDDAAVESDPRDRYRVAAWGASADRVPATVEDQTVRNVVRAATGGNRLQITVSNAFGTEPVTFAGAYVGEQASGADIVPGTNRPLTFQGSPGVTVAPGGSATSDPLPGRIDAGTKLAVSLHVDGRISSVTGHNLARQYSYVSDPGDHADDESGDGFPTVIANWYWVSGVSLTNPPAFGTVVTLGDSITDGSQSTFDADQRWPDHLARRAGAQHRRERFGVVNAGISGNALLLDGFGQSAITRFDRDVADQPGVETVVMMMGINDIANDVVDSPEEIVAGYRAIVERAHAEGICVMAATMTPWEGSGAYTGEREKIRQAVNDWTRASTEFDAVVDMDAALRDPAVPTRLRPELDTGDHIHPNEDGYAAMADAIDLDDLRCRR